MIRKTPLTKRAVIEIADYIDQHDPAAADRFLTAVEQTFGRLEQMPGSGQPYRSSHRRLADLRVWPVIGFRNYHVFYRPVNRGVEIVHVLHGAWDAGPLLLGAFDN